MKVIPLSAFAEACQSGRRLIRQEWPHGVPVTEEAALRAIQIGLSPEWIVRRLLSKDKWELVRAETAEVWAAWSKEWSWLVTNRGACWAGLNEQSKALCEARAKSLVKAVLELPDA